MKKAILPLIVGILTLTACLPSLQTMRSWEQIEVMKAGHLIVLLDNDQEKIEKLRKFGYEERADKLAEKELKQHKRIIEAFDRNFTFCPVYFTLDTDKAKLEEIEQDKLAFLNKNAIPDANIKVNTTESFWGRFEPRDVQEYQDRSREVTVLQLFDKELKRLESPFPGYEEVTGYPVTLSMGYAVKALDNRLNNYYNKPRGKR